MELLQQAAAVCPYKQDWVMKQIALLMFFSSLLVGCASGPEGSKEATSSDTTTLAKADSLMAYDSKPGVLSTGCFQYLSGADTMLLRITVIHGTEVGGELFYHAAGAKNRQEGNILGTVTGDTLIANYSYINKGKRSVREVAFLHRGNTWVEGKGPQEGRDAIRVFSDRKNIEFGTATYQPVACN